MQVEYGLEKVDECCSRNSCESSVGLRDTPDYP